MLNINNSSFSILLFIVFVVENEYANVLVYAFVYMEENLDLYSLIWK